MVKEYEFYIEKLLSRLYDINKSLDRIGQEIFQLRTNLDGENAE